MASRVGAGQLFALGGTLVLQVLLEVTLGRVFVAPNLMVLMLVHLTVSYGDFWAVEGCFWSGLCLDLVLHQPIGASSFSMIVGLSAGTFLLAASSRENRFTLLAAAAGASLVTDAVFMAVASRPFAVSLGLDMLKIFPRAALTAVAGLTAMGAAALASLARRETAT
jgi:cell shape-determining protein MreD